MYAAFDMTLAALVVVFIVDLSGFTDSWLAALSRWLGHPVRSLKPFSCSECMVWWTTLIVALAERDFTFCTVTYAALLSFMATPIGQLASAIRDGILKLIDILWHFITK